MGESRFDELKRYVRFTAADAARLDAIVNVAFTAPDARAARPEIFG